MQSTHPTPRSARRRGGLVVAAAAALAITAAAPAAADHVPRPTDEVFRVPAGQIEHVVTHVDVTGSRAAVRHERQELWLTRNRARMVVTDRRTGRLVTEVTVNPSQTRTYDARTRTLRISVTRGGPRPPYGSMAGEAAVQRAYLEDGITRTIGERTVNGRRALVVESVPGRWVGDEPTSRTVAVVDAETFALHERTTGMPDGAFGQTVTVKLSERLAARRATAARLAMRRHPGARVSRSR